MKRVSSDVRSPVMVVVLHYENSAVLDTVGKLVPQLRPGDRLVVIDNASSVMGSAHLQRLDERCELVRSANNGGYAAGMNQGLRLAVLGDYSTALLLTHEVQLAGGAFELLVDAVQGSADIALAGPLLARVTAPEILWSAGGRLTKTGGTRHLLARRRVSAAGDTPVDCDWLDGSALAVRVAAATNVEGFDEDFYLYWEEVDFARRLRASGQRVVCVRRALAWQEPGKLPPYLLARNRILYWRKARKRLELLASATLAPFAFVALNMLQTRGLGTIKLYAFGWVDGWSGRLRPDLLRKG